MTPPTRLWRVEWMAARRFDTPNDRTEQGRNFKSAQYAARQVAAVLAWPTHMELVGVYVTSGYERDGLAWRPVDPDELPPLDHDTALQFHARWEARRTHPDPVVRSTVDPFDLYPGADEDAD